VTWEGEPQGRKVELHCAIIPVYPEFGNRKSSDSVPATALEENFYKSSEFIHWVEVVNDEILRKREKTREKLTF
jgi:hypothetical protein